MILCLIIVSAMITSVKAEIPEMISYQGKVTDSGGTPVADGTYTMRFRIYDSETGNIPIWDSGGLSVDLEGGIFSVTLGNTSLNPINISFDVDYWLLVTFEGDDQLPRKQLSSVGYAYMASGLVPGTGVSGEVTSGTASAFKGVNTATLGATYGLRGENNSTAGTGVYGEATASTGFTYGGRFHCASPSGKGIYGFAIATTGEAYGVHGSSSSAEGRGVYGFASSSIGITHGVFGESSSTAGRGVCGRATATTGFTYGGTFENYSISGRGVHAVAWATTGVATGIFGSSASVDGMGVSGYASATNGTTYGIYGEAISTEGRAVSGKVTATLGATYGGLFESCSSEGRGVVGLASATWGEIYGVMGITNSTASNSAGVFGSAPATSGGNYGVYGEAESSHGCGVYGEGGEYGIHGRTDEDYGVGVYGSCAAPDTGFGVYGQTISLRGAGVWGFASNLASSACGVIGESRSLYTGYGVYYIGGLAGSGSKSCVVRTSRGPSLMYCQESPENWFEDFGEGRLVNGRCHVELDPLFLETVTIDEENAMKVFVELHDEYCNGVAIKKSQTGFDVVERHGGSSNSTFDYRIVAKRRGFEDKRLDYCKAAETDSYLYPELRESEGARE